MTRPDKAVVIVAGGGRIADLAVGMEIRLKDQGTFVIVDHPVDPPPTTNPEDFIRAIRSPDGETHYVKKIGRNRAERRSLQRNRRNGV